MVLNFGFRVRVVTLRPFWWFAFLLSLKRLARTALAALFPAGPGVGMDLQVTCLKGPKSKASGSGWLWWAGGGAVLLGLHGLGQGVDHYRTLPESVKIVASECLEGLASGHIWARLSR